MGEIVVDRRCATRTSIRVVVSCMELDPIGPVMTTNLTPGGMYVETGSAPPVDSHLAFAIYLRDEGGPLELKGRVVRHGQAGCSLEPDGVGVEFQGVDRCTHERLVEFVERERLV